MPASKPAAAPAARLGLALLLAAVPAAAQMPSTDVWIAELAREGGSWTVAAARNLTARDGYDNQPSFSPDGKLLYYTSARGEQTDVWAIDLASGVARARFESPESEYSPTVTPGGDALSVVRVEADGTQRLWRLPLDGSAASPIAPAVTGVGYHAWLDASRIAVFLLGEPITLAIVDLGDGSSRKIADEPGRALHRIPGRDRLSWVGRDGEGFALFAWDPASGESTRLGPAPASEQRDCAWTPDGAALAAVGSKLYRMSPGADAVWIEVADLAPFGAGAISRLAVSPAGDRIAFVADR